MLPFPSLPSRAFRCTFTTSFTSLQPLPGKVRHVDSRVKVVKNLRAKSADLERIFFDITQKSSKRVLKGSIGAPIPPKPNMRFRPAPGTEVAALRDQDEGTLETDARDGRPTRCFWEWGWGVGGKVMIRAGRISLEIVCTNDLWSAFPPVPRACSG